MPKMKTHRGAAKRFRKTGSGKISMSHSHMNHMSSSKTQKQKRHLRHTTTMAAGDVKRIKQMITYM
ncbi:MAG: 50S ribosomal protein L35 [Firmicutes bacterium]|nr:50S ribosomal protein L35 [Bacillota bacterium]